MSLKSKHIKSRGKNCLVTEKKEVSLRNAYHSILWTPKAKDKPFSHDETDVCWCLKITKKRKEKSQTAMKNLFFLTLSGILHDIKNLR